MRRAVAVTLKGAWSPAAAIAIVTLPCTRGLSVGHEIQTDRGEAIEIALARPCAIDDGDGLMLDSGSYILIRIAKMLHAHIACGDVELLARIAWHLGRCGAAIQLTGNGLYMRNDPEHILLARALGAEVTLIEHSFSPERETLTLPRHG